MGVLCSSSALMVESEQLPKVNSLPINLWAWAKKHSAASPPRGEEAISRRLSRHEKMLTISPARPGKWFDIGISRTDPSRLRVILGYRRSGQASAHFCMCESPAVTHQRELAIPANAVVL